MATNQDGFDFQPYVTPYTGSPIKEFESLGKVLNERYEKNVADWDSADFLLNSIKVLDSSKGFKDKARTDIDNTMKTIIEKGNYEDAKPYVREVVKRLRNDSNLLTSQENYKKAMELEAKIADMTLKGKTPLTFRDYKKEQFDEQGNVLALNTSGAVEEQLDYRPKMEQLFDNVQADGYGNTSSGVREKDGLLYNVSGGTSSTYITPEKIKAIAKNSLDTFIATDEGRQRMRVLTEKGGYNPEQARKILENEIVGVGLERVFGRTQTENSSSLVSGQMNNGGDGNRDGSEKIYNLIDKEEIVDDSPSLTSYGKPEFQDIWSQAFTAKTPEAKSKAQFTLTSTLTNLADSPDKEVSENAKSWLNVIDKAKKVFGDKADTYLANATRGTFDESSMKRLGLSLMGNVASGLNLAIESGVKLGQKTAGVKEPSDEIKALNKEIQQLNKKSTGLIFDTKFEDKVEESLAQKVALNIGWITPDYFNMPEGVKGRVKSALTNYTLDSFDIIRGASKDLSKLPNKDVTITRISNGPIGGGRGVGYIIRDAEGNEHVAVPKNGIYRDQITKQLSQVFGAPDLIVKDKFAKGVNADGQTKPLELIFNENQVKITDPEVRNHSIKKISDEKGYELLRNGKPVTLRDMIKDVSNFDRATVTELAQYAINAGLVTKSEIVKGEDRKGFIIDENALFKAVQKSNEPYRFNSQYDIYKSFND